MAKFSTDPTMNYDDKKRLQRGPDLPPFNPVMRVVPNLQSPNLRATLDTTQLAPEAMADTYLQRGETQARDNLRATFAPAAAGPAAAGPEAPNAFNQTPATLPDTALGGKALTNGVRRYNIGGDVSGPNAAQVYTTMGKDGVPIFTDDAAYAERNSGGGLRRGGTNGVNAAVLANSQGPNAGQEYAPSTLEAKGLSRRSFMDLNPTDTAQALQIASNGASHHAGSEQALSDTFDANQLRARQFAQTRPDGGLDRQVGGPQTFRDRLALAQFQDKQQATKAALTTAAANKKTDDAKSSAAQAQAAQAQAFDQYHKLLKDDPQNAGRYLAGRIQAGIKADPNYLNTPEGIYVGATYNKDFLQKGAMSAAESKEFGGLDPVGSIIDGVRDAFGGGAKPSIPGLNFGNIVQRKNADGTLGGFAGMSRSADRDSGDISFPADESRGHRLINHKPWGSPYNNFDSSVDMFTPDVLAIMKKYQIKGK